MSCNSCMIGGKKKQTGAGKIVDNTKLLESYSIKDLKKLFKHYGKDYDDENDRSGNLAIFSMTLPDSVEAVKKWIAKNKSTKVKKSVRKLRKKKGKNVSQLKKEVKRYKKSKNCSFKLNSRKNQLKEMVKKQNIKITKENATVKDLRASIKAFKKVNCPGLSKMRKSKLLEFVENHEIPLIKFNLRKNTTRKFRVPTPEKKLKKEASDNYEKMKKIYNDMSWDDLAVDGISMEEATSLEDAHKKALKLQKMMKKSKTPKRKLRKKTVKRKLRLKK